MEYYMFNRFKNNIENKTKKKKIIKLIIIVLCITSIVAISILYTRNDKCREILDKYLFRKELHENNLPTIKIDSSQNINIYAYSKYITVLNQNKLKLYNKIGNQEAELDIEISVPIFEANGDYLGIAEKNGKKLYLINNKNVIWQKEIEGNICGININKNGYVSVIIGGTSYKTVVQTFDSNGKELFKKYLSTTNVIDTDISNDNKYLALAEANFSGIVTQSSIEIISIEEAMQNYSEPIKYTHLAKADDLIINIKYNNKNELVCMYDNHIDILKQNNNSELLNFENEDILFADINLLTKVIKIEKKSTGLFSAEAKMQIINIDTQEATMYEIDDIPKEVYAKDNMIVVNLGINALFINDRGWLVKKYQSSQEIQKIVLSNNIAGIVSKNKIEIISL